MTLKNLTVVDKGQRVSDTKPTTSGGLEYNFEPGVGPSQPSTPDYCPQPQHFPTQEYLLNYNSTLTQSIMFSHNNISLGPANTKEKT